VEPSSSSLVQDDIARGLRVVELQRAAVPLMQQAMPGSVTPAAIAGWEAVVAGWDELRALGAPASGLYELELVVRGLADAEEWLGRAHSALHADADAVTHLRRSAELLAELGDAEASARVAVQAERIEELADGDVDRARLRLRGAVEAAAPDSFDRFEAMLELAELHSRAGDTYEARRLLQRLELGLDSAGLAADGAEDIARVALEWREQVTAGGDAGPLAARLLDGVRMRMLRIRTVQALAQIAAEEDPQAAPALVRRVDALRRGDMSEELVRAIAAAAGGDAVGAAAAGPDPLALVGELTRVSAALREPDPPLKALALRAGMLHSQLRRSGIPALAAVAGLQRAEALLGLDRTTEAIEVLQATAAELGAVRHDDLGVRIAALLARAHARAKDWEAASEICGRAIAVLEELRGRVSGEHLRESYLRWRIELYTIGVEAALHCDDVGLAVARSELAKSRWLSVLTAAGADERAEVDAIDEALRELSVRIDASRAAGGVPEDLLDRRRALWDMRLMQVAPRWERAPAFDLAALQAGLAEDEAVLSCFWIDGERLLSVLVDRAGTTHQVRTLAPDQSAELERFTAAVLGGSSRAGDYTAVGALGRMLLPGDLRRLDGKRRLFVSPHRHLHLVPFGALERDGRPLVEDLAVSVVPNLAALALPPRRSSNEGLVALGVGDFAAHAHPWRPLPDAPEEAAETAALWRARGRPAQALADADASEEALRRLDAAGALGDATVVHIATHGESVRADVPMESFLVLHDSLLDGLDIAALRLRADLVVLTACCSGQRAQQARGLEELPADESSGLQTALFVAGARAVTGCLWPVQSAVARAISRGFHERLLEGDPPDVALQRAVTYFRAHANPLQEEPAYWAPFFLTTLDRPTPLAGTRKAAA
jgi:hypothetical protein